MLDALPTELLVDICSYIDIADIIALESVNTTLQNRIRSMSKSIIVCQGKKIGVTMNSMTCTIMQHIHAVYSYYVQKYSLDKQAWQSNQDILTKLSYTVHVSPFPVANHKVRTMFVHCLWNQNISSYSNQIDVFFYYMILDMIQFYTLQTTMSREKIRYYIRVCNRFIHTSDVIASTGYRFLTALQYMYFLQEHHPPTDLSDWIVIHIDDLQIMSTYVASIQLISKLFGIRPLELNQAIFMAGDAETETACIHRIVEFKFNVCGDPVLTHEYIKIKTFLERTAPDLFDSMCAFEMKCVNRFVIFRNPYNSRKVYLTSRRASRLLHSISFEYHDHIAFNDIHTQVQDAQRRLCNIYFT